MNVLVYTRPRIKTFFHELAEKVPSFDNIIYASDHRGHENIWIMGFYYRAVNDIKAGLDAPDLKVDLSGVVRRCRYLRSLDRTKAQEKVVAMTLAVERIVKKYEIDIVFGMVMDSFVLDVFDQVLRQKNSQYLGFLNNMVNGYSRLTSRGELIRLSEFSSEDVVNALTDLSRNDYVPNMQKDFMWKTTPFSMFFTKYLKEKIKITYYFFKKIIDRDPDNFYFNSVASSHSMSCRKLEQIFYRQYEQSNWLDLIDSARSEGRLIVYLPLQFYPECSLDYWGTSAELSNFYSVINTILGNDYGKILIVTKEHPSANALRKSEFYKSFQHNSQVVLAPFDMSSNKLMEHADVVLTWTGSVGVEAVMRKKPLITLGSAYYDPGKKIKSLETLADLKGLEETVWEVYQSDNSSTSELAGSVVEYMLGGLIQGYVFPLDYATDLNPLNNQEMEVLASGVEVYAKHILQQGSYAIRPGSL